MVPMREEPMKVPDVKASDVIARFGLMPHPEGGWYRETWRAQAAPGERAAGTAILYLLERGQRSHWHRIDASEIWLHQSGGPLILHMWSDGPVRTHRLGGRLLEGDAPQAVVPPDVWQAAELPPEADWALVACVVAPGFTFETFEMAPPDWSPPGWTGGA